MNEYPIRLAYNGDGVAFKWAAGKSVRAGLAVGGRIQHQFCDCAAPVLRGGYQYQKLVRDVTEQCRRPFSTQPTGRRRLAVFPRCSLDPYDSDMGAYSPARTALKTSQLTCGDLIFVQLDKKQPEVRHFIGHGVRYKLADIRCFNLEGTESPVSSGDSTFVSVLDYFTISSFGTSPRRGYIFYSDRASLMRRRPLAISPQSAHSEIETIPQSGRGRIPVSVCACRSLSSSLTHLDVPIWHPCLQAKKYRPPQMTSPKAHV